MCLCIYIIRYLSQTSVIINHINCISINTLSNHFLFNSSRSTTMQFTTAAALMLSSVCSAAVLPREEPASYQPTESKKFITHARPKGAEGFENSLGYLYAEYSYPPGYYATLHTKKSDAIAGSISDSALSFGDEYPQGFKVSKPTEQYPSSIAQIYSGQDGTPGMAVEDGLLVWSPDGVPTSWFGKSSSPRATESCMLTFKQPARTGLCAGDLPPRSSSSGRMAPPPRAASMLTLWSSTFKRVLFAEPRLLFHLFSS